ncbi:MAG: tRNA pseudouridine(38-40) synthase TruA, partial [Desulforhopalus sp.]
EIEAVLSRMTCEEICLHGAGRTDAGVHAENMVAHFFTCSSIPCEDLLRGLNSLLPGAIRIYSAEQVSGEFHARFSATGKSYRYALFTGPVLPPDIRFYSLHVTAKLDLHSMRECLSVLEGTHDFSSFENSGTRDKTILSGRGGVRTIFAAELVEHSASQLFFRFTGDGFLRNMVRNLVGTLLEVGRNKISVEEFKKILQAQKRSLGGPTAPAQGLFLERVFYN